MIRYDDTIITEKDYNSTISGVEQTYNFFNISAAEKGSISGGNVVCLASANKPGFIRAYTHISYHKDLKYFLKTDNKNWYGVINMFFKTVKNKENADRIINDIKAKNSIA